MEYAESRNTYKEKRDMDSDIFVVNQTGANDWLMTENDNYMVTENWDYLLLT